MSEEAYDDLLHGNGYHLLKEVITPEQANAVRELALTRLDEGAGAGGLDHAQHGAVREVADAPDVALHHQGARADAARSGQGPGRRR